MTDLQFWASRVGKKQLESRRQTSSVSANRSVPTWAFCTHRWYDGGAGEGRRGVQECQFRLAAFTPKVEPIEGGQLPESVSTGPALAEIATQIGFLGH